MKRKNIFLNTLLGTMILGTLAVGCKDDFTEEDLLNANIEAAEQQEIDKADRAAAAINAAGELLSYSVKVVSSNNEPVAGASVTLQAAAQTGEGGDPQTVTTDANGEAFFGRAVIGGNILSIAADGFLDITASVDFGSISEGVHFRIIDGVVVPTPVTESSIVPLLSDASGDETATISGVVTIETDLTNNTPEVPQDLTLRASLPNFANQFNVAGSINLEIYSFDSGLGIGTATVDNTTGEYTMNVPATEGGLSVEIYVPDVSADQRLAIAYRNGERLDRPEYVDIPTNFGPNQSYDGVPYVPGAIWTFDQPEAAGQGFDFTYTPLGRNIEDGVYDLEDFLTPDYMNDYEIIRTTSLGSGYTNAPLLTFDDQTGSGAYGWGNIEIAIDGLTLDVAGAQLPPNDNDLFALVYDVVRPTLDENGNIVLVTEVSGGGEAIFLTISTNEGGGISQTAVDEALSDAIAQGFTGFEPNDLFQLKEIDGFITNLRFISNNGNPQAEILVSSMAVGRVYEFVVDDGGEGYTDPTFVFSHPENGLVMVDEDDIDNDGDNTDLVSLDSRGSGPMAHANINVDQFATRWIMTPDNSGVTVPYTTLPSDLDYEYENVDPDGNSFNTNDHISDADFGNPQGSLLGALEVDANGHIQFIDQITELFATDEFSASMPRTLIEEPQAVAARVDIDWIGVDDNGGITSYDDDVEEYGAGYTEQFTVTVEPAAVGAPGTDALVNLTDGQFTESGEYEWDGDYEIKAGGSGYLQELNVQNFKGYSGDDFNQQVFPGETYFFNIEYGTGDKQEDVENND
ncbi:carboxypeptidase-like regulatory domain-containing protein [Flagellimonas sp.]|uniref:carboxypeptidase-like regulatory domain-containing protein n=1 Tax=Flagellimonas sp. TaxID=2058762 RepID=UPI003F4A2025